MKYKVMLLIEGFHLKMKSSYEIIYLFYHLNTLAYNIYFSS